LLAFEPTKTRCTITLNSTIIFTSDPAKSDEFDLDEDEEFMAAYRDKRMMEMKEKATPRFGRIIELTERDYCDTIDNAHSSTDVVVFIYEDHIAACRAYVCVN